MIPTQCIITGGGSSIRPDRSVPIKDLELWSKIQNHFTIGTNFVYKWFTPTVLLYGDYTFYYSQQDKLKNVPFIIGKYDQKYQKKDNPKLDNNVYLIKDNGHYYGKESCQLNRYYTFQLAGLASMSLAIGLRCRQLFLLGFDAQEINGYTHFYDEQDGKVIWESTNRTGIGKFYHEKSKQWLYNTGNFNNIDELNNYWFAPFRQAKIEGIEIYNVSLKSKIDLFPKINYQAFYSMLCKTEYNQDEIRNDIKQCIKSPL